MNLPRFVLITNNTLRAVKKENKFPLYLIFPNINSREDRVTTHPLDSGSILIFRQFRRRIFARINSRDFTKHVCKRHRQYPALEKYLFYLAHYYTRIFTQA